MSKIKVESTDLDGNDIVVFVETPGADDHKEAQKYANKVFREALSSGAILRDKIDAVMEEQGIWGDEQKEELKQLSDFISDGCEKLRAGGFSLEEAKKLAIEIRIKRLDQMQLLAKKRSLDEYTVEAQADNARFDCFVCRCVKDEEGKRVFKSVEDYRNQQHAPFAAKAAQVFGDLFYGLADDWEEKLPENEFLQTYGFVNEDLALVNTEGERVDIEGNLIEEETDSPTTKAKPFLDAEGKAVRKPRRKAAEK